jgi:GxxExxY protein
MTANRPDAPRQLVHARASNLIIRCFFDCYNELGYGYLEPTYARAMEILLRACGLQVDREFPIPVRFRGRQIGFHRCDLLVERSIIVELKATERLPAHCERQVRNYLKGLKKDLGFVLHFGPTPSFVPVVPGRSAGNDSANS